MEKKQILEIPRDKFTVDVESKFLFGIIERAVKKSRGTANLSKLIIDVGLRKYNQKELSDRIRKWQKKRRRIYLDYFLTIGKFLNYKDKTLYNRIQGIYYNSSRTPLKISYPIKLSKELALLEEAIKVEGTLQKKRLIFENTNTELTSLIKKSLLKLNINKNSIKETLHIKVQIPEDIPKENLRISNLNLKKQIKNFHERTLKLKEGNKREIIFIESKFKYNQNLRYQIEYQGKVIRLNIFVPTFGKIICKSDLDDGRYQKICTSLRLEIHSTTLTNLFNIVFCMPFGKKSDKIFIPEFIKNSPKEILKEIIGVVLAAESTISCKDRFITLISRSKQYLKDFQVILLKFDVTSNLIANDTLKISGSRNFEKIYKNFDLVIREKMDRLNLLIDSLFIEHSPHGLSTVLYLKSLNELKEATMIQIRNNANRKGNSFRQYIKKLLDIGYIEPVTFLKPLKYRITSLGGEYLKNNITYWK